MSNLNYTVVITPNDPDGYLVTCPALPGLVTDGETVEKAREMAGNAIALYLESLASDREPMPPDIPVIVERIEVELL